MNKQEYFKLSLEQNLPNRCPILGYCDRHSWTLYFFSKYDEVDYDRDFIKTLQKEGAITSDYENKRIKLRAEEPSILRGPKYGHFSNMCPEVNLFDNDNSFSKFRGIACTDGTWDFETNPNNKFEILETKHFSECLEFSKQQYLNNAIKTEEDFISKEFEEISIDELGFDNDLNDVLNLRLKEVKSCFTANAPLSIIVICGSILEGILLGVALQSPKLFNQSKKAPKDEESKIKQFRYWSLNDLIEVAYEIKILDENVKKFSHNLRDFRNYIHPHEQLGKKFNPNMQTAKISWNVLKLAMEQIVSNQHKLKS
ncbi:hypothetical protein [Flavobacterium undicola]|uniref:hypothetical protein n=1 Tax=Flavobacterium undicola TaxID=1932779 RepID=UPI0013786E25|nr:hypothetical protein [Flavobacterium undicola]MBA0885143.1 hypothetical protein [Flavobacterium undicola]